MEGELYGGKAWADMSPDERQQAASRHYVADPADLPADLRGASERFDAEFAAEIAAKDQGQTI